MPLLNKHPFVKNAPPADLQATEEVFFCEPTKEIFRDYDKFFERMILCNSLLWSCELTGRAGLTYLEAAESERAAKRSISALPKEFKRAFLLLCTFTKKINLNELAVDLSFFVKERFFNGEFLQVKRGLQWLDCHVKAICVSSGLDSSQADGDQSSAVTAGTQQLRSLPANRLKSEGVSVQKVIYQVQEVDSGRLLAVRHCELRRDRAVFSRDRLRVLLRHSTRPDATTGYLTLRPPVARAHGVDTITWQQVFVGAPPVFVPNKPAPPKPKLPDKPKSESAQQDKAEAERKKAVVFDEKDDEPLSAVQSEIRQRWEAERRRLAEQRIVERDQRRLRKKQIQEWLKEWSKPREDLTCEDHQELPVMAPVHTRIPGRLFGGCLQVLEFFSSFSSLLEAADTLPYGLSLPTMERALCDTEMDGPLTDILQVLLRALVELQRQEDEETGASGSRSRAGRWSAMDHLDALTLTELLRQHLTSRDGAEFDAKWRYQQRGGYTDSDNPAVQFCRDHSDIMLKLSTQNVQDLSPGERLAVLECLMGEILTTAAARDIIDEAEAKLKETRAELRTVRLNIQSFQKGLAQERVTERREDRQRQQQLQASGSGEPTAGDGAAAEDGEQPPQLASEVDEAERHRRRQEADKTLAEYARKESRLVKQIGELSQQFSLAPLGRDRAYRRYWLGRALPGVFIEHDDSELGCCLPRPTPHNGQLTDSPGDDKQALLRQLISDKLVERSSGADAAAAKETASVTGGAIDQANSGDKENNPKPPQPPAIKTYVQKAAALCEKNLPAAVTPPAADVVVDEQKRRLDALVSCTEPDLAGVLRSMSEETAGGGAANRRLLVCTAEGDECPVHSAILPRTCWMFVPDLQHLDQLTAALNERGLRETELKAAITQAAEVRSAVERCPVDLLVHHEGRKRRRDPASVSGRDPNLNFPAGTPPAEILELLMRDMILECEEKIRCGCLGTIQVRDLSLWRQALLERTYDQQCNKLSWGGVDAVADSWDTSAAPSGVNTPTAGDGGAEYAAEVTARARHRLLVRSLASAILQLAQGVDAKYLKVPLGDDESRHRWERALLASGSLSQLFLHFAQLEAAVQWSKSALNARCQLCRKKSDPEKMLLCDQCDKGFHMYCVKPKIRSIPKGDWFCSTCRPKEKPSSPKKKRRAFTLDEPDDRECENEMDANDVAEGNQSESLEEEVLVKKGSRGFGKKSFIEEAPPTKRTSRGNGKKSITKQDECGSEHKANLSREAEQNGKRCFVQLDTGIEAMARKKSRGSGKISLPVEQETNNESDDVTDNVDASSKSSKRGSQTKTDKSHLSVRPKTNSRRSTSDVEILQDDGSLDRGALATILDDLRSHQCSTYFLKPVNKKEVPDYYRIVREPMDLGTMQRKLEHYASNAEFIHDAGLVFSNCCMFNQPRSQIFKDCGKLRRFFEKRCRELALKVVGKPARRSV